MVKEISIECKECNLECKADIQTDDEVKFPMVEDCDLIKYKIARWKEAK